MLGHGAVALAERRQIQQSAYGMALLSRSPCGARIVLATANGHSEMAIALQLSFNRRPSSCGASGSLNSVWM